MDRTGSASRDHHSTLKGAEVTVLFSKPANYPTESNYCACSVLHITDQSYAISKRDDVSYRSAEHQCRCVVAFVCSCINLTIACFQLPTEICTQETETAIITRGNRCDSHTSFDGWSTKIFSIMLHSVLLYLSKLCPKSWLQQRERVGELSPKSYVSENELALEISTANPCSVFFSFFLPSLRDSRQAIFERI